MIVQKDDEKHRHEDYNEVKVNTETFNTVVDSYRSMNSTARCEKANRD